MPYRGELGRQAFDPEDPTIAVNGFRAGSEWARPSWWGRRWMQALNQLMAPARLARGRTYARHGRITQMDVQVGMVMAQVQGTQAAPYRVRIAVKTLSEADWQRAIEAMVSQALYAAQLLNGEMPHEIEGVFRTAGVALFPESLEDLQAECSCLDWARPCKHVAAVYLLLGERLSDDPFLLFVMRGHTQDQLIAALREKRADYALAPDQAGPLPAAQSDASPIALAAPFEGFWRMGAELETMQIHVVPPAVEMEVVKVLGTPVFAERVMSKEHLAHIYRVVSHRAREVAFGGK